MLRLGFPVLVLVVVAAIAASFLSPTALEPGLAILEIPPDLALVYLLAILVGGAINLRVWKWKVPGFVTVDPLGIIGLEGLLPHLREFRSTALVSINLGGFGIAGALAAYQVARAASAGDGAGSTLTAMAISTAITAGVAWRASRPVPTVGWAIPVLLPALLAAACALLLKSSAAPRIALVAGWLGPVLATAIRLPGYRSRPEGELALGGAGSFEAIVVSCIVSAFLGFGAPET